MRLFYIIILFCTVLPFVSLSSENLQDQNGIVYKNANLKASKHTVKSIRNYNQENNIYQKDIIKHTNFKFSISKISFENFFRINFIKNKTPKDSLLYKRLKFSYNYIFKHLFPHHFFW
jgi:hypothetical protein